MKRAEINYNAKAKELEKLTARLERAEKKLAKATAKAEKYGVENMDNAEHFEWLESVPKNGCYIANQEDIEKNGAWFDHQMAIDDVQEIKEKIERAERNLAKAENELEAHREEVAKIEDMKQKEALWKAEFEEEQREWKKDGIELDGRYYGRTPNGKRFDIEKNGTCTKRGFHCFTLYIDGEVIFTSGEFWRAYAKVKNN